MPNFKYSNSLDSVIATNIYESSSVYNGDISLNGDLKLKGQIIESSSYTKTIHINKNGNITSRFFIEAGAITYTANAVAYNATSNQYLTLYGVPIAGSDSKTFIYSVWFYPVDFNTRDIANLGSWPVFFHENKGVQTVHITAANVSGTTILDVTTALNWNLNNWNHFLISVDLSNSSKRWIYLNDVQDTGATWTTYTNDNIVWSYASGNHGIANNAFGGSLYTGCLSEMYLNAGQYLDLSVAGNRSLFSSNSHPISLGSDGSIPTGTQPQLYLKDPAATAGNNSGTMGNFTINGGPLSSCSATSP
jgi:hypothetical protein